MVVRTKKLSVVPAKAGTPLRKMDPRLRGDDLRRLSVTTSCSRTSRLLLKGVRDRVGKPVSDALVHVETAAQEISDALGAFSAAIDILPIADAAGLEA